MFKLWEEKKNYLKINGSFIKEISFCKTKKKNKKIKIIFKVRYCGKYGYMCFNVYVLQLLENGMFVRTHVVDYNVWIN